MVQAVQINRDTFQFNVRSDAYADLDKLKRYALAEAADQTLASGYDLFQFVDQENRSIRGSDLRPGQILLMKVSRYPAPKPLPPSMFDAHQVVKLAKDSNYLPPHPY